MHLPCFKTAVILEFPASIMRSSKAMGLGAMLLLLILAVAILPILIRYITAVEPHYVISGFQDLKAAANAEETRDQVVTGTSVGSTAQLPVWRPDPNTDYICRSPNGGDQPCPEGTFCDGATQSCVAQYVGGDVPTEGYYA